MHTPSPELLKSIQEPFFQEVLSLSQSKPVLVAFLRHFGCIFCREMVADISELKPSLEAMGIEVAFVHVGSEDDAREFFKEFGLEEELRLSDPESQYYKLFGLSQQSFFKMLSLATIKNSVRAMKSGNRQGGIKGNPKAMPGLFLISKGIVVKIFVHKNPGDKPDLLDFLEDAP
ncbi:MAG: AhpC/TSA family protein [Fimbriimonadaceae bacterium]|nr:AhpC/TSA family protein [Fimbriimonadaceae bacterium]